MKLIGGFSKCSGVCGNSCEVSSVTNLLAKVGNFQLKFFVPFLEKVNKPLLGLKRHVEPWQKHDNYERARKIS